MAGLVLRGRLLVDGRITRLAQQAIDEVDGSIPDAGSWFVVQLDGEWIDRDDALAINKAIAAAGYPYITVMAVTGFRPSPSA